MAETCRRNVLVFSYSNGQDVEVAGFFQHGGVSISTFVGWMKEVCLISVEWTLYPCQIDNNRAVGGPALDSNSGDELQPGRYVIRTPPPHSAPVTMCISTDFPRTRTYSVNSTQSPHTTRFTTRVRARDDRCCINGNLVVAGDYTGFEATHIFPLSETEMVSPSVLMPMSPYLLKWNELNYKCFIEDDQVEPGSEMNSVQQGFLCSSAEQCMFNDYSIGVNPDDNYHIYDFVGRDPKRSPHGKIFYRNPNEQRCYLPSPDLLRDHLRQCVLRHVKGLENPSGVLTLRSISKEMALILRVVAGGQVRKERDNWKLSLEGDFWRPSTLKNQIREVD